MPSKNLIIKMIVVNNTYKFKIIFILLNFILVLFSISCTDQKDIRKQQNITTGMMLYRNNCANCHGKKGEGLNKAYPPLAGTDYILKNKNFLPCIIKNGLNGKINISNNIYNMPMPPVSLTDIEMAQIITYITNEWGNNAEITNSDDVIKNLKNCSK